MKRMMRREFIKYTAGLIGVSLLGRYAVLPLALRDRGTPNAEGAPKRTVAEAEQPAIDGLNTAANQGDKFAMVIDVGACIGCRTCQWACKEENNIPDTISPPWIEVFELKDEVDLTGHPSLEELNQGATTAYTESPREGRWYLPVQCYHCDNPPCVKVCPVGATYKDPDGLVLMDYDRCVGCRFCVVACPYSARRFNWFKPEVPPEETNQLVPVRPIGVVEKCTFCVHRSRQGKLPRCVEVCPVQARHFGNPNDPESEVSKILKSNLSYRLLVEINTDPNISYITRGKK
jgi:molybdopterin-containing oxidoreductase family iron-sulfur binding subunit